MDPTALLALQRTAGNAAVARLAAWSNASSSPRAPAKRLVQRAVGFEFQTTWGVTEKRPATASKGTGMFAPKGRQLPKGQVLHQYPGFKLTADEAGTKLGAELEWVVDPPIQETAGVAAADQLLQDLQNAAGQLTAFQNSDTFTLDQATGDPGDASLEVHPKVKNVGPNMPANPQVTGGIRLDQITTMFQELGKPSGPHQQAQKDLMGMGGEKYLENAATRAATIQGSAKLRGLAAQVIAYLRAGALLGAPAGPGQAYDYAKLIGKIMARTDFGAQFMTLDQAERQPFTAKPQTFAALILNAAQLPGGDPVFERKIKNEPGNKAAGVFDFPVSREDWLVGIAQGKDQLSSHHMPHWKSELEGLGALGGKTDVVGRGEQGVVAEFRSVQEKMPYTQWRPFGLSVFNYLVDLNLR